MGGWERRTLFVLVLLLLETVPVGSKRGGIAIGRSRGASPARNRGSSGGFGGGGGGGGGGSAPNYGKPNQNMYNRQTNYGNIGGSQGGQGWNAHNRQQGGWGSGGHGYQGGHYNMKPQTSRYTSSGKGSFIRSNQFKNMIVGAAAGYLTYQAGKAIIRAATGPMMWQNRPYYWGQSYYQPRPGYSHMCHMPIDASDQQFGNVYFQDQTRPREIVWGCGRYESCCGYECCPSSAPSRNFGLGLGAIILLVVSLGCVGICLYKCCRPPFTFFNQREKYSPGRQFNEGYNPGEACGGGEEGNGAPPAYY